MDEVAHRARKLAALTAMGFERVEPPPVVTERVPVRGGRYRVSAVRPSMGTLVSVTAIHRSIDRAEEAIGRAFDEMDRVVGLLNRYEPGSAVSCLSAEGRIELPPPELSRVVSLARGYHDLSRGAFDITVQPLVDLFRSGGSHAPGDSEILEATELVDGKAVKTGARSISLGKTGMGLTLDGIAKGYVVDVMAQCLRAGGIGDYLINAGGDIRTGGRREDGEAWRVAVQSPLKDGTCPDVVAATTGAVATSGSYEIYFDGERTRHHIVSGRSATSPRRWQSVTVVAPSAVAADALATAVFVLGPGRGLPLIDSLPDCSCLIIDEANRQLRSRGWRRIAEVR